MTNKRITTYRDNAKSIAVYRKQRFLYRKLRRIKAWIRNWKFVLRAKPCEYKHCLYKNSLTDNAINLRFASIYCHHVCWEHSQSERENRKTEEAKRKVEERIRSIVEDLKLKQIAMERWEQEQIRVQTEKELERIKRS